MHPTFALLFFSFLFSFSPLFMYIPAYLKVQCHLIVHPRQTRYDSHNDMDQDPTAKNNIQPSFPLLRLSNQSSKQANCCTARNGPMDSGSGSGKRGAGDLHLHRTCISLGSSICIDDNVCMYVRIYS